MTELVPFLSAQTALANVTGTFLAIANDPLALQDTHDALSSTFLFATILAILTLILSEITGHLSYVDKLWSVLPPSYVIYFTIRATLEDYGHVHPRLALMSLVTIVWGARLTFNFARRGGYSLTEEDYRWPWLRARFHPLLLRLLNWTFVATFQHYLLYFLALPAFFAYQTRHLNPHINTLDVFSATLFLTLVVIETVADEQQYIFQTEKYRLKDSGRALTGDYKAGDSNLKLQLTSRQRGFSTTGLFRYSRHPNFFCEMSIWWTFYLFSISALWTHHGFIPDSPAHGFRHGGILNWSAIGVLLLTLVFQGSTPLTEYISSQKYPAYLQYQKTTSRIIPWFSSKSKDE
ncbi:hypothetical protein PROFUN_02275 [Planoprotostelium fungivorum]|uniref:Uncharacterized protein n=1 Tax=Planoprotostelium fungivorum TaxID=1890364 RepID=A0A2P6NYG6_9EUKA|nr:hypothetical protein PROFUN_02275 [Planoprotostelium fungivorum]